MVRLRFDQLYSAGGPNLSAGNYFFFFKGPKAEYNFPVIRRLTTGFQSSLRRFVISFFFPREFVHGGKLFKMKAIRKVTVQVLAVLLFFFSLLQMKKTFLCSDDVYMLKESQPT